MINYLKIMKISIVTSFLLMILNLGSCYRDGSSLKKHIEVEQSMNIKIESFGQMPNHPKVGLYVLTNSNGLKARITNYGGILVSLEVPDRNGKMDDVVLGYDNLESYINNNSPYFGAIIGRYANRIANGKFSLDGIEYQFAKNDRPNHLHGGIKGFDKVLWNAEPIRGKNEVGLKLTYLSKDMEEGYPGNLKCTVIYTLTEKNELRINYDAVTDKKTIINLTNHSYFNLGGQGKRDILDHSLMLNANNFTPVDETLIPTGRIIPVKGTAMDFTGSTAIGLRINDAYEQIKLGKGYDHNWVLNKKNDEMTLAARVSEPASGRVMEVYTTEPGIQFYSGNFLDGSIKGKEDKVYNHRYGFCLETQHYPDSPNKPQFPTTTLRPDEEYSTTTIYKFSIQ